MQFRPFFGFWKSRIWIAVRQQQQQQQQQQRMPK
jgi:hypothetical protein